MRACACLCTKLCEHHGAADHWAVCLQAYPCLCSYYAIYKLGRFSFYLLVPRHTSAYSLLANAMLMCRFAPPLAFNFMAGIALPPGKSYSPGRDVTETVSRTCLSLQPHEHPSVLKPC